MRPIKLLACSLLVCLLVGCGGEAHEFNEALVGVKSSVRKALDQKVQDVNVLLIAFDGSDAKAKIIDTAYGKLVASFAIAREKLAKIEVPSGLDNGQELYDAVSTSIDDVEAMVTKEMKKIVDLTKQGQGVGGAAIPAVLSQLKEVYVQLQKKAKEAEQALFQSILPDFERAVKSVMEEKKYSIILRREAALLVTPEYDITEQVVAKMNK